MNSEEGSGVGASVSKAEIRTARNPQALWGIASGPIYRRAGKGEPRYNSEASEDKGWQLRKKSTYTPSPAKVNTLFVLTI